MSAPYTSGPDTARHSLTCACPCGSDINPNDTVECEHPGCDKLIHWDCTRYGQSAWTESGTRCEVHQFVCSTCGLKLGTDERAGSGVCIGCATEAPVDLGIQTIQQHIVVAMETGDPLSDTWGSAA